MGKTFDVVRRVEFDASLVDQVRARGVEVIEGEGVEAFAVHPDRVEVATSAGRTLEAAVLVGADGAASVVRKRLLGEQAIPHRLFMHELSLAAAAPATMIYDFSLMARGLRGYLWLFPAPDGRLNVGLMHYPSCEPGGRLGGRALTGLLADGLRDHGVALPARGSRGWPVWGYRPGAAIAGHRVVLVGDAAGIDGLTGEGIAVAMEQAMVAGDAIDLALFAGRFDFAGYRRAIRRAVVGRELALDRWLARLLYGGPRWREFLSLVLFDPDVLELYARRVDGTEILADQKLRLYRALIRHAVARGERLGQLAAAERLVTDGAAALA
jgi:flavin-dependent dehydrogenase